MEASEVLQWRYYLSMEPRGESRRDINTAQVCQLIAQGFSAIGGSRKPVKMEDFILKFEHEEIPKEEKVKKFYNSMRNILGGKLKKVDETNKNKE